MFFLVAVCIAYYIHKTLEEKQRINELCRIAMAPESVINQNPPRKQPPVKTDAPMRLAQSWLDSNALILDTETTGLHDTAEIVDIALIDCSGAMLLDTLVKPTRPIPLEAQHIHGITNAMVSGAPTWADIHDRFCQILDGRPVVVYNREYDHRLLRQTMILHRLHVADLSRMECAMLAYAEHRGDWNNYHGNYRWHTLINAAKHSGVRVEGAHRAKADCLMTLGVIRAMADPLNIIVPKKKTEHEETNWEKLKRLKLENNLDEAEAFLLKLVVVSEDEGKDHGVSPWCYESLAILYRKQKRIKDEVELLRRYAEQKKAPGVTPAKLAERLVKAEALLIKKQPGSIKGGDGAKVLRGQA